MEIEQALVLSEGDTLILFIRNLTNQTADQIKARLREAGIERVVLISAGTRPNHGIAYCASTGDDDGRALISALERYTTQ